ncbi:interaptin [Rhagoletis pomonella]|uniref:interaptin n=1 Tax=Rhagoletis pomonella TaxID=28610 RepID=UPI00177E4C6D|nr:interaptin [Rhagoletis pomonella]
MQRPRRTSEFCEEPGTATKRSSRSTQQRQSRIARPPSIERQTLVLPSSTHRASRITPQKQMQNVSNADAPGTAHKYNSSKSSHITRPSSMERQTGLPGSTLLGSRTTPQKTPNSVRKLTSCALFNAEKQRSAHNDKIWVQERAQRIVEHLRKTAKPGAVHGLAADFFARSGCLRTMSTKQFIGIVNYFLHYIWGTRFTVGSNYVDDIINILQKLKYPYQVNKSWLKTPNASHSFGYVIQLLDFLMDFVPPENEEEASAMQFELEDPEKLGQSSLMQESPDADFTELMLQNSEEGFMLWDKQKDDDLQNLQQQTCGVLIYKRSGLQGTLALDAQIHELKQELKEEQKKRPHIRKEDEEHCLQLKSEHEETHTQIKTAQETLEAIAKQLSEKQAERQQYKDELMELLEEKTQIKNELDKQTMSVDQLEALAQELEQGKYTLKLMERTLCDLKDRQHHQQVLLARHKKQLTDLIAKYNDSIREVSCTKLQVNVDALLLPLNPEPDDVNERIKLLEETRDHAKQQLEQMVEKQQELEKQENELNHEIMVNLNPQIDELETALKLAERNSRDFEKQREKQNAAMNAQLQELEERLQEMQAECKSLQDTKLEKQTEISMLENQNEELMTRAEREYKAAADEREAFLNDYEKTLERSNQILSEFEQLIEQRDLELQQIEEEEKKVKYKPMK